MSKEPTAFKHPKCGGVIQQIEQEDTVFFECDACGARAEEIDTLILQGLVIFRTGRSAPPMDDQRSSDGTRVVDPPV